VCHISRAAMCLVKWIEGDFATVIRESPLQPFFGAASEANFRIDDDSIPLKLPLAAPLPADW